MSDSDGEPRPEGPDDVSSSSSSSDEDEEEVRKELETVIEEDFFKTLSIIKEKDPRIYDGKTAFFSEKHSENVDKGSKKEKPLYLSDYERKVILEKGGIFEDEDDDEENDSKLQPTFAEEERQLKEAFRKIVYESSEEDEEAGGLLVPRRKTKQEREDEEAGYVEWLKGQKAELEDKKVEGELKALHDFWNNPDLDESEKFLRDYILNKRFLDKDDEKQVVEEDLSEDEKNLIAQSEFEKEYNFRYEDEGKEARRYPRVIEGSLRKIQDKRRKKRAERRERKLAEKEKKREAILEQQKQKRKEIEEKLKELKEITKNDQLGIDDAEVLQLAGGTESTENSYNIDCEEPDVEESRSKKKKKRLRKKDIKKTKRLMPSLSDLPEEPYKDYVDELYDMDCEDFIDDIPCKFKYRSVVPNDYGLTIEEILMADDNELNRWCSLKKMYKRRAEHVEKNEVKIYKQKSADLELKKKILPSLFRQENDDRESDVEEAPPPTKKRKKNKKLLDDEQCSAPDADVSQAPVEGSSDITSANQELGEKLSKKSKDKLKQKKKSPDGKFSGHGRKRSHTDQRGAFENQTGLNLHPDRLKAYGIKLKKFKRIFKPH